jgi:hypothetical protein
MYATKSSIVHINDDMKNICNGVKNGTISCFRKAIIKIEKLQIILITF